MLTLGQEAKDRITGFTGVLIGRIEYLNGCVQYLVQPKKLINGKVVDSVWVDVQRLDPTSKVKVGGPGPIPPPFSRP